MELRRTPAGGFTFTLTNWVVACVVFLVIHFSGGWGPLAESIPSPFPSFVRVVQFLRAVHISFLAPADTIWDNAWAAAASTVDAILSQPAPHWGWRAA